MKRKSAASLAAVVLLFAFVLAGCRKNGSEAASKVESAGKAITSTVSGVLSETVSKAESTGEVITSTVSGIVSGLTSG